MRLLYDEKTAHTQLAEAPVVEYPLSGFKVGVSAHLDERTAGLWLASVLWSASR